MTTPQALIIGASRGIGLGLATTLAERGWQVTATTRGATPHTDANIAWLTLDINRQQQRDELAEALAGRQFDTIFINAGVFGPAAQDLTQTSDDELAALFLSNAISPVRCATQLLPLVKEQSGIMALMSSDLASLNENPHATYPLYSASKAALNMLARGLLPEAQSQGKTLLCVHPGWVQTDMGGAEATLTIAQSVNGIADRLQEWQGKGGHHYIDWEGSERRW
ncbi:SDR family oxidoreductase [Erwinia sp. E602]|uniref:SDR family oxidoreductase n=1 Tax=unclassified Erwinia TaxID=2622719 RepID=UPI000C77E1C9|nr:MULTISPECIES: SDR family oxidoreductase [unclassified Erwinia]PLV49006.1 short-chain dehydrogenase [Erwinia sp. B116]QUG76749.1 SDR family oxidoreductase [Erwinia sp. E602]